MYVNFYKFAHNHVRIKERKINGLYIRDYSHGLDEIIDMMKPYTINFSQKQAVLKPILKRKFYMWIWKI